MNSGGCPNGFHGLRAGFKNRPVRGPGLQGFVILAISRRPRALTRRPPTILKHALAAALFACVSRFVSLGSDSGVPCGTRGLIGVAFQGRRPWLISAVPAGRSIAEGGMRKPAAGGSCCAGRAAGRPGRSRSPFSRAVSRNFFHLFSPNCVPWVRNCAPPMIGWRANEGRKRRPKAE